MHTDQRGTGQRYNQDKPPLELIPLWLVLATAEGGADVSKIHHQQISVLRHVADFQRGISSIHEAGRRLRAEDLELSAQVFAYGAQKYAAWNWLKGMQWSIPFGCIARHYLAMLQSEELDPESGLPHWGHIVCNILMLAQYEVSYPEGDDRPDREYFRQPDLAGSICVVDPYPCTSGAGANK